MGFLNILIGLFIFIIGPLWLCLLLRKRYPRRQRLGMFLCVLFPLFGQFYLKDPAWYVVAIFGCGVLLYNLSIGGIALWICMGLISAALMYYRFTKITGT